MTNHRLLIGLFLIHNLAAAVSEAAPPNIIFLFADDQRADTISAHGNPHIHTPNLVRFAAEGSVFAETTVLDPLAARFAL